jgi:hypothetical protein
MKNPFSHEPEPDPPTKVIREEYGGDDDCPHVFRRNLREYISYRGNEIAALYGTSAEECLACKRMWATAVVYA